MNLLTGTEASKLLRISRETVRAMLERGDLKGFSRGRVTRITLESVEALVGPSRGSSEPPLEGGTGQSQLLQDTSDV